MSAEPLWIDIETRSPVDLSKTGVGPYVAHPDTRLLVVCYALGDGDIQQFGPSELEQANTSLLELLKGSRVTPVAHNAQFEIACLPMLGEAGSMLARKRWLCTLRLAGRLGLPQKLDSLGKYLKLGQKDPAGAALIGQADTGIALTPEQWAAFVGYCAQDVNLMRRAGRAMMAMIYPEEKRQFLRECVADIAINRRGIPVDSALISAAADQVVDMKRRSHEAVRRLTGVPKATSRKRIMETRGVVLPKYSVDACAAAVLGKKPTRDDRVLAGAMRVAGSQSLSKWEAAKRRMLDGRVTDCYAYCSQVHGRWGSYGIQMHNIPRSSVVLDAHSVRKAKPGELKDGMRSLVTAPEMHWLAISDFRQIEFRILCWMIGQTGMLETLKAGADPYVVMAQRMFGETEVSKDRRQMAKSATLGLGYGMGVRGFSAYANMSNSEAADLHGRYHKALPKVSLLHRQLDQYAREACSGRNFAPRKIGIGRARLFCAAPNDQHFPRRTMGMLLPSDRILRLYEPHEEHGGDGVSLRAWCQGRPYYLWGGTLTEYVVCGTARDLLARAVVRAEEQKLRPVAHTHDELICEISHDDLRERGGRQALANMLHDLMCDPDPQGRDPYAGLPLDTETAVRERWAA